MKDVEVIKALECCSMSSYPACRECPYHGDYANRDCVNKRNADIKNLINRRDTRIAELEAQNNDLFYKLNGVMLSVDKWLEGKELKQDEVNRAITMREKTLHIVEKLEAEIERLNGFNENLLTANTALSNELLEAKSEAYREYEKHVREVLEKRYGKGYMQNSIVIADLVNLTKELTEKNDFEE